MKNWIKSSLVIGHVRQAVNGSVVLGGILNLGRLLMSESALLSASAKSSVVMARLLPRNWRSASGRVATLADRSSLFRTIDRCFERVTVAWRKSVIGVRLDTILHGASNLDAQRVRLIGWTAFMAATTHIMLIGIDALVADTAGGLGWVAALPFALACICRPEAVVAAWQSRRPHRRVR